MNTHIPTNSPQRRERLLNLASARMISNEALPLEEPGGSPVIEPESEAPVAEPEDTSARGFSHGK